MGHIDLISYFFPRSPVLLTLQVGNWFVWVCIGVYLKIPVCLSIDSHRYPEDEPFDSFVPAAAGAGGM